MIAHRHTLMAAGLAGLALLAAALIPTGGTAARSGCPRPAEASVNDPLGQLLTQSGYVAVPLTKLPTGHELLAGCVNGRPALLILDSGAGGSVIHASKLKNFGLAPAKEQGDTALGVGGSAQVLRLDAVDVQLGGLALGPTELHSLDLSQVVDSLKMAAKVEPDGIIGQDILTARQGILDIAGNRVFLLRTPPAAAARGN